MSKTSKNIIVTGASRGIGRAIVDVFKSQGHRVWALSRNTAELSQLPDVESVSLDIGNEHEIKNWISSFDDQTFDVLINNAGLLVNKPFSETTAKDFEAVYRVNVFGVANLIRNLLPLLTPQTHIVNISSMGGINGTSKFPGLAAYSSSKGALGILTELLAEEFKDHGPSVNALALGAVQTEMLEEAFPGYKAPLDADQMASYIADFALNGHLFYNGKVLPLSSSTP
ncbi:MAG: SDR family oxidoreductase [Flavobacteriaceae bacterium]|nr:SDR family oxidoreductase [Flavobacteriaceae bacterium]